MTNERRNVIAPTDWWKAFEVAAKKEGKSVSEWLRDIGFEKLPASVRKGLGDPPVMGRPKKSEDAD